MRDDLRLQRRLAAAAEQWAEGGRDPSFLLTGSRLQQAEAWAATTGLAIGSQTQQFVVAGVAERDRVEQEQRTRLAHEASLEPSATHLLVHAKPLSQAVVVIDHIGHAALTETVILTPSDTQNHVTLT